MSVSVSVSVSVCERDRPFHIFSTMPVNGICAKSVNIFLASTLQYHLQDQHFVIGLVDSDLPLT